MSLKEKGYRLMVNKELADAKCKDQQKLYGEWRDYVPNGLGKKIWHE